jgi:hypothetical protein
MKNNKPRTNSPFTFKDIVHVLGVLLVAALIIGVPAALLINWLEGIIIPWIAERFPWLFGIAGAVLVLVQLCLNVATIALAFVVPTCLVLSISRRSRWIGAMGLLFSSTIIFVNLAVWSLIWSGQLAGILWMAVGILLGGVGGIPIAFIAAIIRAEWTVALAILVVLIIGIALRTFAGFLVQSSP